MPQKHVHIHGTQLKELIRLPRGNERRNKIAAAQTCQFCADKITRSFQTLMKKMLKKKEKMSGRTDDDE